MAQALSARRGPSLIGRAFGGGSVQRERRWAMWGAYICLAIFAVMFLFPPYYMLVTSFKTNQEIAKIEGNPWIINEEPTLEHYYNLINDQYFPGYYWNTIIVTVAVVAITMVVSVLAAYSLSRLTFWGSSLLATGVFLTYLIPETLLFLPLFEIIGGLGLLDTLWALIIVYPTLTVPFCTWILIGYFASIPKELDEAALIDGANYLQMITKVFIPVALPGLIAATIFAFTVAWSQFLYPMAFIYSNDNQLLVAGTATTLIRGDVLHWGGLMAGAMLAAAPPVILYAFLMDYYIAGLTSGATKG